ncbi:MAG: WbqC family protein [Acidaminococcaceae bacterium]|nr:WbqC family protein [Acidaminococcaceae bacterium]
MKIGIMQPYFFPYIGYFQLLNMVDKYVVFDTASFSNIKWGIRNQILINGAPAFFRVKTLKVSQNKPFNEIQVSGDPEAKKNNIHTLECAYGKAPYFSDVMPLLERFLLADYDNLAQCNVASNRLVCDYLGIKTEILLFSELDCDKELKMQYRIYDVCKVLGGDEYINAIGGTELYDFEEFRANGLKLAFLKADDIVYPQFGREFVPHLSIIDIMMFNSVPEIQDMLNRYTLIES